MNGKRGLQLGRVVLLGRTFQEYCAFFALNPGELRNRQILDVAAGVSSFAAEAAALGINATAVDPIYDWPLEQIAERCQPDLEAVYRAIGSKPAYRWGERSYASPESMKALRERACRAFLHDYSQHPPQNLEGRAPRDLLHLARPRPRYLPGALPRLPFADQQFDLALCSYFLFVYEDLFDCEFHRASILELMRVAKEARIYPLVTFEAERSSCLARVLRDPSLRAFKFEEVGTQFEFLLNSNAFLKISHA